MNKCEDCIHLIELSKGINGLCDYLWDSTKDNIPILLSYSSYIQDITVKHNCEKFKEKEE